MPPDRQEIGNIQQKPLPVNRQSGQQRNDGIQANQDHARGHHHLAEGEPVCTGQQHRPKNDSQSEDESTCCQGTGPPISAISPKTMKTPPHITTSKAQSRPTTNRKRYRPTTCAVRETGISPRMALCPADSSDDAGPNALIHAIADAKPPSPPIRPLTTCSSTWVDIITSDTTIDSTGKTSRNTIFATLNRPVPTQSNRHCFTTDFQLIVTIPLKQICERQLHTRFHMPQPSLPIPQ